MIILVPLTGFEHDSRSLELALIAAKRLQGEIDALHVAPDPMTIVTQAAFHQFTGGMGNVERIHALEKAAEAHCAAATAAFEGFKARHAGDGLKAALETVEGDPIGATIAAARIRDLVVAVRAPAHAAFAPDAVGTILVGCGRPLLLAPDAPASSLGSTIAIAWKETAEAARAITAAMPFIAQAKKVVVITAAEAGGSAEEATASAERLAAQLRRHGPQLVAVGIAPSAHGLPPLVAKAKELGADLLVSGAYSHSRTRELVFGGFTRDLLKGCELPVLLVH